MSPGKHFLSGKMSVHDFPALVSPEAADSLVSVACVCCACFRHTPARRSGTCPWRRVMSPLTPSTPQATNTTLEDDTRTFLRYDTTRSAAFRPSTQAPAVVVYFACPRPDASLGHRKLAARRFFERESSCGVVDDIALCVPSRTYVYI